MRRHAPHEAPDRRLRAHRLTRRARGLDRRKAPGGGATATAMWSGALPKDEILTNITIDWLTETIGIVDAQGREMSPRAGAVTRTTFVVRSSQARGGRTTSPAKIENPNGTSTRRACWAGGIAALARYFEEPELYAEELRAFLRTYRTS